MFKVGDLAVYPAQGVGIIESIESREVMGSSQAFYIMKILGSNMKIMIPLNSAKAVGLREIISAKEIPKIYEILKNKDITIDKSLTRGDHLFPIRGENHVEEGAARAGVLP